VSWNVQCVNVGSEKYIKKSNLPRNEIQAMRDCCARRAYVRCEIILGLKRHLLKGRVSSKQRSLAIQCVAVSMSMGQRVGKAEICSL